MKKNLFSNSWFSIFYNENYIIRKNLFLEIEKCSPDLKGKLLDFGCGTKPYKDLLKNVDEYIGLDFPNDRVNGSTLSTDIVYDGKNIPLNNATFDAVLSTEVFEHVYNLDDTIKEINRVLKKGGMLLITCPFAYPEHEAPYDFARYSSFGIKYLLEKNGFSIVYYKKTGSYVAVLLQLISLYIFYFISKFGKLKYLFFPVLISPLFLLNNFIHLILPASLLRQDLYLNNIVLCKKENY
jgi:SAM-dependent methyltransferase